MNTLLQSLWMERLGWALLHSLWQGATLWMLVSLILVAARRASAAWRHRLACLTLAFFVLCPVLTTAWLARPTAAAADTRQIFQAVASSPGTPQAAQSISDADHVLSSPPSSGTAGPSRLPSDPAFIASHL